MAAELIQDRSGGAVVVKFSDLPTDRLKRLALSFPEALREYAKRTRRQDPS